MKLTPVTLSVLCALPMCTLANETSRLAEISVIAVRDPSILAQQAYTTQRLDKKQLSQQQSASLAQALKNLPNIDIQGGSRAIAQKPIIRGLSGNRVVQIVDGVRQNFELAHRGSYFVPMSLIEEVEVIKGPASTLWGSGALGGAVAVRTSNALDLLKNGDKFGAKFHQGYQSASGLSETDLAVFGATERFDWLVQGSYNKSNDLRLADGDKLPNSRYKQTGGMVKFGWQISDAQRVELSHRLSHFSQTAPSNNEAVDEFTDQDLVRYIGEFHRTNRDPSKFTAFYGSLHTRLGSINYLSKQKITDQSTALNYLLNPADNPYLNTQFTLYHNRTDEKETRVASGVKDRTKFVTTGFNLRNASDFNGIGLTYGVDYYQNRVNTERGTNNADAKFRANPYRAKDKVIGAYLLANLPLGERVIFSPSVRYDHFSSQSGNEKKQANHWSPSVALTVKATSWLDLTAKYQEAFRAPSLQERFVSGAHFGTSMRGRDLVNRFVANPNLKPETAQNKEVNAKFHFENVFTSADKLLFNATYFQNDVKDLINLEVFKTTAREPIPTSSQYQNIANARLRGVELAADYQHSRYKLGLSYAQTRGKDKNTGEALSQIAADKWSAYVDYVVVPEKFNAGVRVTHYAAQKRVPKDNPVYEGYTLTDIYATYAPRSGEWQNLRLDFAIENLFDKRHQPAFSLIEGSGRNVKLSLGYTF